MKLNSIWRQTIFTSLLHACHTESALSSADHISFLSILSFFSDFFLRTAPMNKQHRFETITLIETNSITMHFYINRANICVFRDRDFSVYTFLPIFRFPLLPCIVFRVFVCHLKNAIYFKSATNNSIVQNYPMYSSVCVLLYLSARACECVHNVTI